MKRTTNVSVQTLENLAENLFEALGDYNNTVEAILGMHGACCDPDSETEEFLSNHLRRLALFATDLEAELRVVESIAQTVEANTPSLEPELVA